MKEPSCEINFKRGWRCIRVMHTGPCALVPRWWNIRGWIQWYNIGARR